MHTQGQTIEFIEKCFGSAKLSNAGLNASVWCPICNEQENKKKLVIQTETLLVHCWKCGYKSKTIFHLIKKYKSEFLHEFLTEYKFGEFISDKEIKISEEILMLPDGFVLLAEQVPNLENSDLSVRKAVNYLFSRGLTLEDFWYFKLGIATKSKEYEKRIIIPSFDFDGNLNFFTSRAYTQIFGPKYLNPIFHRENTIFNEINIDWSKELTIVEGPFDLIKVNENSTCLLGKELNSDSLLFQKIIKNKTPILVAIDADAKNDAIKIAKKLIEYDISVKIYQFPKKIKDPGQMSKKQFVDGYDDAIEFNFTDILFWKLKLLDGN